MSKINILRIVLVFIAGSFFTWFGLQFWAMKTAVELHSRTFVERVLPVTDFVAQQLQAQQSKANQ